MSPQFHIYYFKYQFQWRRPMCLYPFFHCFHFTAEFLLARFYPATEEFSLSVHSATKREAKEIKVLILNLSTGPVHFCDIVFQETHLPCLSALFRLHSFFVLEAIKCTALFSICFHRLLQYYGCVGLPAIPGEISHADFTARITS